MYLSLGPLGWIAILGAIVWTPLIALGAGLGLVGCFAEEERPRTAWLRAISALTAANLVALATGLLGLESIAPELGVLAVPLAVLAVALMVGLPLVAVIAHRASAASGGFLHRVAAWPFWSLAVGLGGAVLVGAQSAQGFVFLLAPALLLAVGVAELLRGTARSRPRSTAQVLHFIAPVTGLASCAVCQEPVRNRRVTCSACAATQHKECFEFMGHCGGAGCLSRAVR